MMLLIEQKKNDQETVADVRKIAVKCMNQMTWDKLISKQEAMCFMGNLKLYSCSEAIEMISLSGYKQIENDGKLQKHDYVQKYAGRDHDLKDLSFYEWISAYKTEWNQAKKQVIPHFVGPHLRPTFSVEKDYTRMLKNDSSTFKVELVNNKLDKWLVHFEGAEGTLYAKEKFT